MTFTKTVSSFVVATLLLGASPAYAIDANLGVKADLKARAGATTSAQAGVKAEARAAAVSTKAKERANQEIMRRTEALAKLKARVNAMVRLSAEQKSAIVASLDAQASELAALNTKIQAQTDAAALKSDVKSITTSHRIFALVMPQTQIVAAADRINASSDELVTFATKLDSRIEAAKTAGKDVAALVTLSASVKTKAAAAKTDAGAAVSLSAGLMPDGGDKVKMEANKKALTEARAKLKSARDSLSAAHKDAQSVAKMLRDMKIEVKATASTTVSQ